VFRYPLVLGALLTHEQEMGFIQVRMKKHRWHKKILKNQDPIIFSIGWRRFQVTFTCFCLSFSSPQ
jgi:ribosome biogenesis protein BMS1